MNHIYIHEAHRKLEAAIRCGNWRNTIDAAIQLLHQAIDAEAQNVDALLDHELEAHEKWSWPAIDRIQQVRDHLSRSLWMPVNEREWKRKYGTVLFSAREMAEKCFFPVCGISNQSPDQPTPTPALPSDASPSPSEPVSALEGQGFSTFKTEGEL